MIIYCLFIYKCASNVILSHYMSNIALIYTVDMPRAWPPLLATVDLIGHSITVHVQYIHHALFQTTTIILPLHPSSFEPFITHLLGPRVFMLPLKYTNPLGPRGGY